MYNYINANNLDSAITEARNVLSYSLHLPLNVASTFAAKSATSTYEKLNILSKAVHEVCSPLFSPDYCQDTGNSFNLKFFSFFREETGSALYPQRLLSCFYDQQFNETLKLMISHHCMVATYDKLLNTIFHDISIDAYDMARHFNCYGFNYALKQPQLTIKTDNNQFSIPAFNTNSHSCAMTSAEASNKGRNNYSPSYRTLYSKLSNLPKFKYLTDGIKFTSKPLARNERKVPTSVSIPMSSLPLLHQLRGHGKELSNIVKLYDSSQGIKKQTVTKFMECVSYLQNIPKHQKMMNSDRLYYDYKLEGTFHFNLAYCLTKNIISFDEYFNQHMCEDVRFIELITSIVHFPNTFSRHLFLQFAFDSYTDCIELETSFLTNRLTKPRAAAVFVSRSEKVTSSHDALNNWENRYRDFIDYMCKLVFPVYESCFYVLLYDTFFDPNKSSAENALSMYYALDDYLSSDEIYKGISHDAYVDDIIKTYNSGLPRPDDSKSARPQKVKKEEFISSQYDDSDLDPNTFSKVVLSLYNHISEPTPSLIDRDYLYRTFKNSKFIALSSCIADMIF